MGAAAENIVGKYPSIEHTALNYLTQRQQSQVRFPWLGHLGPYRHTPALLPLSAAIPECDVGACGADRQENVRGIRPGDDRTKPLL